MDHSQTNHEGSRITDHASPMDLHFVMSKKFVYESGSIQKDILYLLRRLISASNEGNKICNE